MLAHPHFRLVQLPTSSAQATALNKHLCVELIHSKNQAERHQFLAKIACLFVFLCHHLKLAN